jgi:hypothetical protein
VELNSEVFDIHQDGQSLLPLLLSENIFGGNTKKKDFLFFLKVYVF